MKSRRTSSAATMPIRRHNIHEGKNEPMMLIWGPITLLRLFYRPGAGLHHRRLSAGPVPWPVEETEERDGAPRRHSGAGASCRFRRTELGSARGGPREG